MFNKKKAVLKRLLWSVPIIIVSTVLLILFLSTFNEFAAPDQLFLPIVFVPIFALIVAYQVVYDIFFFLALHKNSDKIESSKAVKKFFPKWQRITVKIGRIFIPIFSVIMILWCGFSSMNGVSYEKGVDKYLSPQKLLNCELTELSADDEAYSDFFSLFPMMSYSESEKYLYKNGDENENISISVFILERLPNSIINSCYEREAVNSSEKAVYNLSENPNGLMSKETTNVPFEMNGFTGYYTVERLVGSDTTTKVNSTEIAVKANGVYVKMNISFSNAEDFAQLDIDKVISEVCDLANAVKAHSLYSPGTALSDFSSRYLQ